MERSIANAADFFYVMPDLLEHLANLPIASFVQSNFEPRIVGFFDYTNLRWGRAHTAVWISLFRDGNSTSKPAKMLLVRLPGDFDQVSLRNV